MAELVPVRVRDCQCPDSPHPEGDFAYLKPEPDFDIGMAVHGVIGRTITDPDLLQIEMGRVYLRFGVVRWDLQDAQGKPLPLGLAITTGLSWVELYPLADKASNLYGSVLDPLVARLSKSSRNGSTDGSTSAKTPSTAKRQRR